MNDEQEKKFVYALVFVLIKGNFMGQLIFFFRTLMKTNRFDFCCVMENGIERDRQNRDHKRIHQSGNFAAFIQLV